MRTSVLYENRITCFAIMLKPPQLALVAAIEALRASGPSRGPRPYDANVTILPTPTPTPTPTADGDVDYELRISRLTIDKLGVRLYDRVSAVVAELVANSYDADAKRVVVELPLATLLSVKEDGGAWTVVVRDNGHGLTPEEARKYYLRVGADRRARDADGALSRKLKRPVMGRKGIGKLAPFGICTTIEVLSAGGPKTDQGYIASHFLLDFDKIIGEDRDEPVVLEKGPSDNTWLAEAGTIVTLSGFLPKRVPDGDTFMRQLERRFALADPDFEVLVNDTRTKGAPLKMKLFAIEIVEATKIDVAKRPVVLDDGTKLPVTGWVAMAREAYKNEESAGVRIYARGKIVATTRDFEQPAGYTGEFATRSYMVGEIHADWLDDDSGEDLIRTDRQSILWESERGSALRTWGAEITREIGRNSRAPRQALVRKKFREVSKFETLARERFTDESVIKVALEIADTIGGFAAEDELEDEEYVQGLAEVILSVAPHRALIAAFQDFERARTGGSAPSLENLLDLFGKTRVAEAASYAQIAIERIQVLEELDAIVFDSKRDEAALQKIITQAPWLIQPDWTVLTANQTLKTFKSSFEAFLKRVHGIDVDLAIEYETKKPDFVLTALGGMLHFVEIKASGHALDDADFQRLYNYVEFLQEFFTSNTDMAKEFPRGWRIDLVVDSVNLKQPINKRAYGESVDAGQILQLSWDDFRLRAIKTNEAFLEARDAAAKAAKNAKTSTVLPSVDVAPAASSSHARPAGPKPAPPRAVPKAPGAAK
jgi:hypothetical protein